MFLENSNLGILGVLIKFQPQLGSWITFPVDMLQVGIVKKLWRQGKFDKN